MYEKQPLNGNCQGIHVRSTKTYASHNCPIPLLPASTRTSTTELLGLHPSGIGNEEGTIVCHELLLQLQRAVGINVLGVVRNEGLGDSLTDSIDLRCVSTTLHPHTNIKDSEGVLASDQNGLVDLEAEDLRLNEMDRRTVDADETTTLFCVGDCGSSLYRYRAHVNLRFRRCTGMTCLLFTKRLNGLNL